MLTLNFRPTDGLVDVFASGLIVATIPDTDVAVVNGAVRIVLPVTVEAPTGTTVVERHVEPTREQLLLAVNELPLDAIEHYLLQGQADAGMATSMASIVREAVSRAVLGAG